MPAITRIPGAPLPPPLAGAIADVSQLAPEGLRPLASKPTRVIAAAGLGFAVFAGLAFWADQHYGKMPDDPTLGSGEIDRVEARSMFSGPRGFPSYVAFTALLSASFLYSHGRERLSPKEFSFLQTVGYGFMGGGLIGTTIAPSLLRPLPAH